MPRSSNAQLAVDMYEEFRAQYGWTRETAWKGIARQLLTCEIWQQCWQPFRDIVVYRKVNDFKIGPQGPNVVMRRAEALTGFLANELGVSRAGLCSEIAAHWRQPRSGLIKHTDRGSQHVSDNMPHSHCTKHARYS